MDVDELSFAPAAVPLRVRLNNKSSQKQSLCMSQLKRYMSERIYQAPIPATSATKQPPSAIKGVTKVKLLQRHRVNMLLKSKSVGRPFKVGREDSSPQFFQQHQFNIRVESFQPYEMIHPTIRPLPRTELSRPCQTGKGRTRTAQAGRAKSRPQEQSDEDSLCGVGSWETGGESQTTSFLFR